MTQISPKEVSVSLQEHMQDMFDVSVQDWIFITGTFQCLQGFYS